MLGKAIPCCSGNKAVQVCFSPNCPNYPFICLGECECGLVHDDCQFLGLQSFLKKIAHKSAIFDQQTKKCMEQIKGLAEAVIEGVRREVKTFEEWLAIGEGREFMRKVQYGTHLKAMKGSQIFILNRQIQQESNISKLKFDSGFSKQVESLRKQFEACISRFKKLYTNHSNEISFEYTPPSSRLKSKSSQKLLKNSHNSSIKHDYSLSKSIPLSPERAKSKINHLRYYSDSLKIDSKITGDTDTLRAFQFPRKVVDIRLLFRASENQFRITKFHEECDNISNTLVIVKLDSGRILGGYTPMPWQSLPNLKKVADPSLTSFLFSLTFKQKYPLLSQERAIYCWKDDGPNFGHGADLVIKDRSNVNRNSHFNFPSSYSSLDKYERARSTYVRLLGQESAHFRTIQWQVFKVVLE